MKEKSKKKELALVIVKGEGAVDRTPFKGLLFDERDELFALYDRHHGNHSAVAKDIECEFGRNRVIYYCTVYDFKNRLKQEKAIRIEIWKKNSGQMLIDGKRKVVEQALKMLETKEVEWVDKKGNKFTLMKEPSAKELEVAYRILKTELGESINITSRDGEAGGKERDEEIKAFRISIKVYNDDKHKLDTNKEAGDSMEISDGQNNN